jgi:hypothetical protein
MDLPIVCTLTQTELMERRRTILASIRDSAIDISATEYGYSYRFEPSSEVLAELARLVDLERQCCQFLTFRIVVEPQEAIRLDEITGPPEAKAIMADIVGA